MKMWVNFPVLRDKKTGALLDEAAFYTKADQSAFPATKQESELAASQTSCR